MEVSVICLCINWSLISIGTSAVFVFLFLMCTMRLGPLVGGSLSLRLIGKKLIFGLDLDARVTVYDGEGIRSCRRDRYVGYTTVAS